MSEKIKEKCLTVGSPTDWWEILRPFAWTASFISICLGGILSYQEGTFSLRLFLPVLIAVSLLQSAGNIINEYYDYKTGIDNPDSQRPSTVLVDGRISPWLALTVSKIIIILFMLGAAFYTWYLQLLGIPFFVLLGCSGAYFYTAPPLYLKYRGLGTLTVIFVFGIILTQAVYYVFTGNLSLLVIWYSLPISLLVGAILQGNDLRDIHKDRGLTISSRYGFKLGVTIYLFLIFTPYLLVFINIGLNLNSPWALLVLLSIPKAIINCHHIIANYNQHDSLHNLDKKTAQLHFLFGIFWLISFFF